MNFGDYLGSYIAKRVALYPVHDADIYHMIGSVIDPWILTSSLRYLPSGTQVAYWCCGCRSDAPIPASLSEQVILCGARGPLSRDALGLPKDTALGDPALLLPLIYTPQRSERTAGRTVCIPHVMQDNESERLRNKAGADVALSTWITDDESIHTLLDDITSASFVLSGSLHGAIVAHAYGVPYSYWRGDDIDVPFKWDDFAASVGRASFFADTVLEGIAISEMKACARNRPRLTPILACAPFAPRSNILVRAIAHDAGLSAEATVPLTHIADQSAALAERTRSTLDTRVRSLHRSGRALHEAWAQARHELIDAADAIRAVTDQLSYRANVLGLHISSASPRLDFTRKGATGALLKCGWSAPDNGAPWSLAPKAQIVIPANFGWEGAKQLTIHGLLFAPNTGQKRGTRQLSIWINEELLVDTTYENKAEDQTIPISVSMSIPAHLRALGAQLSMELRCNPIGSLAELGLGQDTRQIGFALIALDFAFPTNTESTPYFE